MRDTRLLTLTPAQENGAAEALRRMADAVDRLAAGEVEVQLTFRLTVDCDRGERLDQLDDTADVLQAAAKGA